MFPDVAQVETTQFQVNLEHNFIKTTKLLKTDLL